MNKILMHKIFSQNKIRSNTQETKFGIFKSKKNLNTFTKGPINRVD